MAKPGQIVVLNGAPRSGKSSIASAIQAESAEVWMNLGVDAWKAATPESLLPGIGLRPGGERPELEAVLPLLFAALYESVAATSRLGLNVVADLDHHDGYTGPLGILADCAARLRGLPVLLVAVRCPIDVVWQRRAATWGQRREVAEPSLRAAVDRWQQAVHAHGVYDLEVDTSLRTPDECAGIIAERLRDGPPGSAFERLAANSGLFSDE